MKKSAKIAIMITAIAAVAPAFTLRAGTATNTTGPVQQGQSDGGTGTPSLNNPAVTISFAGQTALLSFLTSPGISLLQPGTSITLHDGTGGAAVTYYAPDASNTNVQLASRNFGGTDTLNSGSQSIAGASPVQVNSALRLEWQSKGSLDGFYDLINDQVGYTPAAGPVSVLSGRGPSTANPIYVNGSPFSAPGPSFSAPGTTQLQSGQLLTTGSGLAYYNTYSATNFNLATGQNLLGGANRVQFSLGEYKTENFSYSGTPSPFAKPGQAGFGLGNPSLTSSSQISGVGVANSRQQFNSVSVANLSTDKVDPQSTTGQTYAAGPWNTAGADNIDSQQYSATAVTVSANPGTGLQRLNLSDTQWLETTGRLANGALFNDVSRVANTGQRNVLAINTGIDPTWAVGANDGGDTSTSAQATAQTNIGSGFRLSGKSSGTFSRNAIAQSRLGVGALSLAEARGAASNAPIRALDIDFTDTADPVDGSGNVDHTQFLSVNSSTFLNGTYKAILISNINTVKAPNAAYVNASAATWAAATSAQTGIKGDPTGDVGAFVNNIVGSVQTFGNGNPTTSVGDPADALIANGFLPPQLLNFKRVQDGDPLTPNVLDSDQQALQDFVVANYPQIFSVAGTAATNNQTTGTSSPVYGAVGSNLAAFNGTIPITSKDDNGNLLANGVAGNKGNVLFGNFNQNGVRDYAAVKEAVNAALSLFAVDHAKNSAFTADGGVTNSTVVTPLSGTPGWATTANTKGDLIVLGDFNSDGKFDGADLLLLARGSALADNTSSDHLTVDATHAFSDQVRSTSVVLRKNAALDYVQAQTASISDAGQTFLRQTAESAQAQANDAANHYLNAFNKFDVNHDGNEDLTDARVVGSFLGKSYTLQTDQLTATIASDGTLNTALAQKSFNLVDAKLVDGAAGKVYGVNHVITPNTDPGLITSADLGKITTDLVAQHKLVVGDWGLTGASVAWTDAYLTEDAGFLHPEIIHSWLDGDANGDGVIDAADFALLDAAFASADGPEAAAEIQLHTAEFGAVYTADLAAAVPEPASLLLLGLGAGLLARRRVRGARK